MKLFKFFAALTALFRVKNRIALANIAEGTHAGSISKLSDGAIGKNILVKFGTDANHIDVCGVADSPIGVTDDEATAAEELIAVKLLGSYGGTVLMTAGEAITAGERVYTAALGKIQNATTSVTYYLVGVAVSSADSGGLCEVDPCAGPVVVVA